MDVIAQNPRLKVLLLLMNGSDIDAVNGALTSKLPRIAGPSRGCNSLGGSLAH